VEEEDRLAKMEEEENNPMKALENRTVDSKREMDILDALQDIRDRNSRNERVEKAVDLLARLEVEEIEDEEQQAKSKEEEEDEKLVREVFSKVSVPAADISSGSQTSTITVKRKAEGAEPDLRSLLPDSTKELIAKSSANVPIVKKRKLEGKNSLGIKMKGKATAKAVA